MQITGKAKMEVVVPKEAKFEGEFKRKYRVKGDADVKISQTRSKGMNSHSKYFCKPHDISRDMT